MDHRYATFCKLRCGLTFPAGKRRREAFDFLGGSVIKQQLAEGVARRRVGLVIPAGAPARQHSKLLSQEGTAIGCALADRHCTACLTFAPPFREITSGGFSPCLSKNIAIGYVATAHAKVGTAVQVEVRGKVSGAVVTKMPFVPANYFKGQ